MVDNTTVFQGGNGRHFSKRFLFFWFFNWRIVDMTEWIEHDWHDVMSAQQLWAVAGWKKWGLAGWREERSDGDILFFVRDRLFAASCRRLKERAELLAIFTQPGSFVIGSVQGPANANSPSKGRPAFCVRSWGFCRRLFPSLYWSILSHLDSFCCDSFLLKFFIILRSIFSIELKKERNSSRHEAVGPWSTTFRFLFDLLYFIF